MLAFSLRASLRASCISRAPTTCCIRIFTPKVPSFKRNISRNNRRMFSNAFAKPTVVVPTEFGRVMDRKDPLTKALHSLERAVESNDVVHALRVCTMMKQRELRPTPQFYRLLLQVLAENNLFQEVEAIFEDAIALGVKPDREMWNYLLQSRSGDFPTLSSTIEAMKEAGHELNATSYRIVLQHHATTGNMVMCLRVLKDMKQARVSPEITTVETMVVAACREHLPRLARSLAVEYEKESARRLSLPTWTQILASSAHCHYVEGIIEGWGRVVDEGGIILDEGLCTMIIEAAGAAGVVRVTEAALGMLKTINVPAQEYHIAPLMNALCKNNELPAAIDLFERMDELDIQPNRFTAKPLRTLLLVPENLELAIKHLRNNAETKGQNLASAFNTVLAVTLRDRSNQTIALGLEMDDMKVVPTIDTFNILIHGASIRRNVTAVHTYYEDIINRGLEPNKETYERIIVLLITEPVYDDAFLYLHKMESARLQPSADLLMALAKKCSLRYDARWKQVVKQMEKLNYEVSDELMEYLISNGLKPMGPTDFDNDVSEKNEHGAADADTAYEGSPANSSIHQ